MAQAAEPRSASRRSFLIASGAVLAGVGGVVTWEQLERGSHKRTPSAAVIGRPEKAGSDSILVILSLYGGNDGLNTIIPIGDNAYHDARGNLAYSESEVIRLDATFGLNPELKGIKQLWDAGQVAVIHGVGYPKPDHSHFRSMDIWQTGSPTSPVRSGWLGRWLDSQPYDPLRAINMGGTLPPLLVGASTAASTLPLGDYRTAPETVAKTLSTLGVADAQDSASEVLIRSSYRAQRAVQLAFAPELAKQTTPNAKGSLYDQLDLVARCISMNAPTKVYSASLGGFDTHAGEAATQRALLKQLDGAVSAFFASVAGSSGPKNVVLVAYSEFGRRVRGNASLGSDHGTAGPVLIIGPSVKGGHHGDPPDLRNLDLDDLRYTTDFRSVYAELLESVMGADPTSVNRGKFKTLGFFL